MRARPTAFVGPVFLLLIAADMAVFAQPREASPLQIKPVCGALWPWSSKKAKKTPSPTPTPKRAVSQQSNSTATPAASATATAKPTPTPKRTPAANATIPVNELAEYENNSDEVRYMIDVALGLTTLNLDYRYGSSDPTNGGMDCSGFVYYVLSKCGVRDVPRDARDQYIWVRKAGDFQAVLGQSDDSFELNALKPGDLLFWGDPTLGSREPTITQTMIYLGREKSSGGRIMVGATEAGSYKDQLRSGVSVVDFQVRRAGADSENQSGP